MTLKVTDNQYDRPSWRQLGLLFLLFLVVVIVTDRFHRSQAPVYDDSCQYEEIPIDAIKPDEKSHPAVTMVTTSAANQQTATHEVSRL